MKAGLASFFLVFVIISLAEFFSGMYLPQGYKLGFSTIIGGLVFIGVKISGGR